MSIQIHNSLSGKDEPFVPIDGKTVRIYACGPTVYDSSHLGHARMAVVWDVIQRYLRFSGYDVIFVRNITDVEDKIINRAAQRNISPDQLARLYTYEYWHDMNQLNVMQPDFEPKATEFIPQMIEFVQELIAKGHAYEARGDVYFDVSSFKEYGKLSKQNLEQLVVGAREQVKSQDDLQVIKRNPVDFALWKKAEGDEVGWPSPWGKGRPGWHLECSTMIRKVLGDTIDIHGGGEDLVFPHHENEIAQSESLLGKPLAKYWLHNGFVQMNSEKMSKSLGNYTSIQDLLKTYSADTLRLLLLQIRYRNPIDLTSESLAAARTGMQRLVRAAAYAQSTNGGAPATTLNKTVLEAQKLFVEAMDNDFNTAEAIAALFKLADAIYQSKDAHEQNELASGLIKLAQVLGFTLQDTSNYLDNDTASGIMDLVLDLRKVAREKKDYATSDLIRAKLSDLGISVKDTASGATWEKS